MMILQLVLWMLLVSGFSLLGAWYARRYGAPDALVGLYVSFVIISNIIAYKVVAYDLGVMTVTAPAATIVFAVTFLLTDVVNERFGRSAVHRMIFVAFLAQLAVALFLWLAISLPPAPFWTDQEAYARLLGATPRIMVASLVAFFVSENADAYLFSWWRRLTNGKHLWARNALSSLPAMAIDSALFVFIAFAGIAPLWSLMVGVVVMKWVVAIIDIPLMYANRRVLRQSP
jgi:uncharacterized integral membrane protein (TIGR00697 family)